jgi:ribonuclease VapC
MVVDSSVFVAVVLDEERKVEFLKALTDANSLKMSSVTLGEASIVLLSRGGQVRVDMLNALVDRLNIEVIPVDRTQAGIALDAFRRFGKGRHVASLNLGDCFTYALTKYLGEQLLFQGNDFVHTDLMLA